MDIKVEYLEEAQKYIGLMPEKARRKMLYKSPWWEWELWILEFSKS